MSLNFPKSCCWLSIRAVTLIIGFGGLAIGLLFHVALLEVAIRYSNDLDASKSGAVTFLEFLDHLTFLYMDTMRIIFSVYLLFGTFKNYPIKTCYIFAWLVFQCVATVENILNILAIFWHHGFYVFLEDIILTVGNIGSAYLVYSYYHSLPKKIFTNS